MPDQEYEVYVETFKILEWRDFSIYKTKSLGHGWMDKVTRDRNRPVESGLIYAAPSDVFSQSHPPIRIKRG